MTVIGAATTRDRWDSDLTDLLGLDTAGIAAVLPARRHRTGLVVLGAVAIIGSLAAGVAVQRWRGSVDGDQGGAPARAATIGAATAGPGSASRPSLRPDGDQRIVQTPVPLVAEADADPVRVDIAACTTPVPRERAAVRQAGGRTRPSDRPTQVRPNGRRLAAIGAALSETAPADGATASTAAPADNRVATRERDAGEPATRRDLVVPLRLLLPSAADAVRRGASVPDGAAESSGDRPGTRRIERTTEALDALRSLRRQ